MNKKCCLFLTPGGLSISSLRLLTGMLSFSSCVHAERPVTPLVTHSQQKPVKNQTVSCSLGRGQLGSQGGTCKGSRI